MRLILFAILVLAVQCLAGSGAARAGGRDTTLLRLGSFFGGEAHDRIAGIARDDAGNIFVAGVTESDQLPIAAKPLQNKRAGDKDIFLAKFSPDGRQLVFATYFGGSDRDEVRSLTLDRLGSPVISGVTHSTDFPATSTFSNAPISEVYSGGAAFVARFSPDGAELLFAAVLGGSKADEARDAVVADDGTIWVVGSAESSDFPVSQFAPQPSLAGKSDGFLAELNPTGTLLVFSTYFGGSGSDAFTAIALDGAGNAYCAGTTDSPDFPGDASPRADADIVGVKFRGGVSHDFTRAFALTGADASNDIAVSDGQIYVAGSTAAPSLVGIRRGGYSERTFGQRDALIVGMTDAGVITAATFFGGPADEDAYSLAMMGSDVAVVGATTSDVIFPTPDAFSAKRGGGRDGFVAVFDPALQSLKYCSYTGGSADDEATAATASKLSICLAGTTGSPDFPVSHDGFDRTYGGGFGDGFVQVLSPVPLLAITPDPVDFGDVEAGRTITLDTPAVKNVSLTRAAFVDSIRLEGNDSEAFTLLTTGFFFPTLPPGASSRPRLIFSPKTEATFAATLAVWANGVRFAVPVRGRVLVPPPQFSAAGADFDTVEVNTQAFDSIRISNLTARGFTVDSIRPEGASDGRFVVLEKTPFDVPSSGSRSAKAMFFPATEGQHAQTFRIFARGISVPVVLRGFAKPGLPPPVDSVALSGADFGDVTEQTSAGSTVTVKNLVPRTALLDSITIESDAESVFSVQLPPRPWSIGAGDSLVLPVAATPPTVGKKTAQIAAYLGGRRFSATLTANGTPAPVPVLSANDLHFAVTTAGSFRLDSLFVKNSGGASAAIQQASAANDAEGDFSVEGFVPKQLAAGDSSAVRIRFAPHAAGNKTAKLNIETSVGRISATLTGFAPPPDTARVVVQPLIFRPTTVDSVRDSVVVVVSAGNVAARIDAAEVVGSADFTLISPPDFPLQLAPGGELALSVRFAPKTAATLSAILRVKFAGGEAQGTLEGRGFVPPDTPFVAEVRAALPERAAAIGEIAEFPLVVSGDKRSLDSLRGRQFIAKIRFNASVMAHADGRGEVGDTAHIVTLSGGVTGDTLAVFRGIAALGNADSTLVQLLECSFTSGGSPYPARVVLSNGTLRVNDSWRYGGPRLVGGVLPAPVIVILPNPVAESAAILLYRVQPGCVLTLYDATGRERLRVLPEVNLRTGEAAVNVVPETARGIYFCRVVSGGQTAVKALFAE